ncbi:MAG: SH3 domain-containing protein [Treponema sp.]|nr:SH3 domain-containing protein [Treponema sp.]MCL2271382.1 SH3 domain-containing protein [Treponema sp.]
MRIMFKYRLGQLLLAFILVVFSSCFMKKEEMTVSPPVTSPLSRNYIGYGVITASFTHITGEPSEDSPSLGYLRRGSVVRIIKRQSSGKNFISWVQLETENSGGGWLKEEVMDIYNSESQAKTASELLSR